MVKAFVYVLLIGFGFAGGVWGTKYIPANLLWRTPVETQKLVSTSKLSKIVSPGKIEPDGEERHLSFDGVGIIHKIHIKEGDLVKKGALLGELQNDEQKARLNVAERVLDKAQSQLALMVIGSRQEDIDEAKAESMAWQASADFYLRTLATREKLRQTSAVSLEDLEEIRFKGKEAAQRREAALSKMRRLQAGSRPEEIAIAKMEVAVALAKKAEAQSTLDRTRIFAPLEGTIIRVMHNEGEAVTGIDAVPVILLANLSRLFVRAEIDDSEVELLRVGLPIIAKEKRPNPNHYPGKLVKVLGRMGRRHLQTDDPHDLVDRRVLEVLAELDGHPDLRLQQRMDVYITLPKGPEIAGPATNK